MQPRKTLKKILQGSKNVRFQDIVSLMEGLGFREDRVRGDHHIFVHPVMSELVNLQSVRGQVKPYQIRQVLRLMERYNLSLGDDE